VRTRLAAALLLLALSASAQPVIDIIREPSRWTPDELFEKKFPWEKDVIHLTPEEKRLIECLSSIQDIPFIGEPQARIAMPHSGVLCRLESQAMVLVAVAPEARPALANAPDPDSLPLALPALRAAIHAPFEPLVQAHRHLTTLDRQRLRLEHARAVALALNDRWGRLESFPVPDFKTLTRNYRYLTSPQCVDRSTNTLDGLVRANEPLAFLPDLHEVMASVNLSSTEIVPIGVDTCERGAAQVACAAAKPVDWTQSCWSKEDPDSDRTMPCAASQAQLQSHIAIGTGCNDDYESQFTPFFAAPDGREWPHDPTIPDTAGKGVLIASLRRALIARNDASTVAEGRWKTQRDGDWDAAKPAFLRWAEGMRREHGVLDTEKARLDAEQQSLNALALEIRGLVNTIATATTTSQNAAKTIAAAELKLRQLELQIDAAENDVVTAEKNLDTRATEAEAVTLNCGGADYGSCTNTAEKLRYDRARYEAYERVRGAQIAWLRAMQDLQALRKSESQTTLALSTATVDQLRADQQVSRASISLRRKTEEEAKRTNQLNVDSAVYAQVRPQHDDEWMALQRMAADLGVRL